MFAVYASAANLFELVKCALDQGICILFSVYSLVFNVFGSITNVLLYNVYMSNMCGSKNVYTVCPSPLHHMGNIKNALYLLTRTDINTNTNTYANTNMITNTITNKRERGGVYTVCPSPLHHNHTENIKICCITDETRKCTARKLIKT